MYRKARTRIMKVTTMMNVMMTFSKNAPISIAIFRSLFFLYLILGDYLNSTVFVLGFPFRRRSFLRGFPLLD